MEKITITNALDTITRFNQSEDWQATALVEQTLGNSLSLTGNLEFGVFTCPPINARLLLSDSPERYILTDSTQNNFEKGGIANRIIKLFKELIEQRYNPTLRVIIGDTDEIDYFFPVLGQPARLNLEVAEERKDQYAKNLEQRLKTIFPWTFTIDRYSQIDLLFDDQLSPPSLESSSLQKDLKVEQGQIAMAFREAGYYEGYPSPTSDEIKEICRLKFQTYAYQGCRLGEFFPNMTLIQNEFPLLMRTRMLNILNQQTNQRIIPAIYPIADRSKR